MTDNQESLEKQVLADIRKTGFINELLVASALKKRGWYAQQNVSYTDKDEKKSREIDVCATLGKRDETDRLRVVITLLIEVKTSMKRPWVVFSHSADENRSPRWSLNDSN